MEFSAAHSLANATIEYHSLGEMTAKKLRHAIVTGELAPGARITETEISNSMGVSRIVVREAILMLIREGLFIKERNKFTMVPEISLQDVVDIFEFRIAIEQAAAKRCIQSEHFASKILPTLQQHSEKVSQASRQESVEAEALLYMDINFHSYLIHASSNTRLINAWEELSGPLLMLLHRYMSAGCALEYSHTEIIEACQQNDIDRVQKELFDHIEDTKCALITMAKQ